VVLIFGLVIIALSIILGYQETQAKKALVNFILIAALINFTPVICGLVIDLSKIIMDILLKGGVPPTISTLIAEKKAMGMGLADLPTAFVMAGFCIFASIIYILFALLFLVRVVYLWILVILSPIAFATKVLPGNKYILKIFPRVCTWDGWWDDFLQWTFIGIPAAGAIYLSNVAMYAIAQNPTAIVSAPSGNALTGTLALLFSYSIPFVILVVGFFTSLDSGGAAGSKIKGIAKGFAGTAKSAAVGGTLGFASGAIAGRQSGATLGTIRGAFKGGAQGALIGGETEKKQINRWYTRNVKERLGLAPTGATTQEEQKEINSLAASYKNIPVAELQRIAQQNPTTVKNRQEKIAAIMAITDRGENLHMQEINWVATNRAELIRRGTDLNKIAETRPDLAPQINGASTRDTISSMSGKKFQENVRADSFHPDNVRGLEVFENANPKQIKKTLEDGSPEQISNLQAWLDQTHLQTLLNRRSALENWITDDNAKVIKPHFEDYEYDKENPGVVITVLN
jgi:hypothetical protein